MPDSLLTGEIVDTQGGEPVADGADTQEQRPAAESQAAPAADEPWYAELPDDVQSAVSKYKSRDEAQRDVSLGLLKAGIRGIKYADGASRYQVTTVVDANGRAVNLQGERNAESFVNGFTTLDEAIVDAERQARNYLDMRGLTEVLRGWKAKGYALKEAEPSFNYVVFSDNDVEIAASFSRTPYTNNNFWNWFFQIDFKFRSFRIFVPSPKADSCSI
jgi:hypothetical protein